MVENMFVVYSLHSLSCSWFKSYIMGTLSKGQKG